MTGCDPKRPSLPVVSWGITEPQLPHLLLAGLRLGARPRLALPAGKVVILEAITDPAPASAPSVLLENKCLVLSGSHHQLPPAS